MKEWLRFFFSTPNKFLATAAIAGIIVIIINPNMFLPVVKTALALYVVLLGIRWIISP